MSVVATSTLYKFWLPTVSNTNITVLQALEKRTTLKQDPAVHVVNTNNKNICNFCLHSQAAKQISTRRWYAYTWQIKHTGSQAQLTNQWTVNY
jgi:hypothetical protein